MTVKQFAEKAGDFAELGVPADRRGPRASSAYRATRSAWSNSDHGGRFSGFHREHENPGSVELVELGGMMPPFLHA